MEKAWSTLNAAALVLFSLALFITGWLGWTLLVLGWVLALAAFVIA